MSEITGTPSWRMSRPISIEQAIQPYMVKKATCNPRRYDIFHPSAWGSCLRKIAYQYYNETEHFADKTAADIDPRMERIFDNGHSIHARWQNYLDCAGILRGNWKCTNPLCGAEFGHEEPWGIFNPQRTIPGWRCHCGNGEKLVYEEVLVKSEDCYNFEGHCDAVVDVRGTDLAKGNEMDVFVVDFKSIKDSMYSELTEPKHEHVIQTHIYMWVLNIHAAVVLYENKDNQAVRELFVPRDEQLIEKIKTQAIWLKGMLASRKLPTRPSGFSRSKFPCRYCEFVDICFQS